MEAYKTLGHMEPVPRGEENHDNGFYMPHHAVLKRTDPEGKIRVVFNASFKTSTGMSLNDVLLPGPKLQPDLWLVLTRWRLYKYAFTADIIKMFRQIRIHREDTIYQKILWRADPTAAVQDFRLATVTYGTVSAPFLTLRTLLQLAQDEGARFPVGSDIVRSNMYVDDILAGGGTEQEARRAKRQVTELLESGGFRLSKWAGSHPFLSTEDEQEDRLIANDDGVGALGILWNPARDILSLRAVPILTSLKELTKRRVLSDVARLFDPVGWGAPVLVKAKTFLQDL